MKLRLPARPRSGETSAPVSAPVLEDEAPLFDEELLARFRRLVLLSRQSIAEGLAGEHRSRRRGSSPEFADFKMYSQGDDFRRIDWNLYARLDEVFVRLSEVTTELSVHILLDASKSMDWRGDNGVPRKFRYARQLAGALGYVSLWHFDRIVIAPFSTELLAPFGPAQGRAHQVPLLSYLTRLEASGTTDLPSAIERYARARRRPGMLIVISDLLSGDPAELAERLRDLRARGWQTIVAHIVDPLELSPDGISAAVPGGRSGPAELVDLETGERLKINPTQEVIERYEAAVSAWVTEIEAACIEHKADYLQLQTDWSFQSVVLRLLHRRGLVA